MNFCMEEFGPLNLLPPLGKQSYSGSSIRFFFASKFGSRDCFQVLTSSLRSALRRAHKVVTERPLTKQHALASNAEASLRDPKREVMDATPQTLSVTALACSHRRCLRRGQAAGRRDRGAGPDVKRPADLRFVGYVFPRAVRRGRPP